MKKNKVETVSEIPATKTPSHFSATVLQDGIAHRAAYSLDVHGHDFEKLAKQYADKLTEAFPSSIIEIVHDVDMPVTPLL